MKTHTGSCLEHIDHEFLVPLAVLYFLGGLNDGVGEFFVHQTEFFVGFRGRLLHHA